MTSVTERDTAARAMRGDCGGSLLDPLAAALTEAGLQITTCREAQPADVAKLGSSWAKRLGIPARRPAWLLTAQKPRVAGDRADSPPRSASLAPLRTSCGAPPTPSRGLR